MDEIINNFLTFFIFVLGLITVILSDIVSHKFHLYKKALEGRARDLSRAVAWQLAGEAIIGLGTLIFSAAAFFGVLEYWSISVQSSIRFTMFFATSVTTLHLHSTLKKMSDGEL